MRLERREVLPCPDCGPAHLCCDHENERLRERVAELECQRDEALDRLDVERRYHDETRGYRQHAAQRIAELEVERDELIARHGELVNDAFLDRNALRARLAKYEAVVAAAREIRLNHSRDKTRRELPYINGLHKLEDALRALDSSSAEVSP